MTKNKLFISFIFIICLYILINPYESVYYCKAALSMCAKSVVPSLFLFIVLSKIISGASQTLKKDTGKSFFCRFFLLPKILIPTVVSGLFFGAPAGAVAINEIYQKKLCTKNQAQTALTLCNNCSTGFILTICAVCLESTRLAALLAACNIITTITVYFLLFRSRQVYCKNDVVISDTKKQSLPDLICTSVNDAVISTIILCGYILIFYTFSGILSDKISYIISHYTNNQNLILCTRAFLNAIFEMSSGVLSCSVIQGNARIIICSMCVAFCGLSVIFQVMSVLNGSGISAKDFILAKILSAFICPVYMVLFLLLLPPKVINVSNFNSLLNTGFSENHLFSFLFIFLIFTVFTTIIAVIDKNNKN